MARGGKRSGAGRPKGSKSKESAIVKAERKKIEAVVEGRRREIEAGVEIALPDLSSLRVEVGDRTAVRAYRQARSLISIVALLGVPLIRPPVLRPFIYFPLL
jgi:hypothetical protein